MLLDGLRSLQLEHDARFSLTCGSKLRLPGCSRGVLAYGWKEYWQTELTMITFTTTTCLRCYHLPRINEVRNIDTSVTTYTGPVTTLAEKVWHSAMTVLY